jgi:hypothetical protein
MPLIERNRSMAEPAPPNLIEISQMFLVPAAILFGALGLAGTEQLKTLISLLGLATSILWIYRVRCWAGGPGIDRGTTLILASIFALTWSVSLVAHAILWYRLPPISN